MWFDIILIKGTERIEAKNVNAAIVKSIKNNKEKLFKIIMKMWDASYKPLYYNIQPYGHKCHSKLCCEYIDYFIVFYFNVGARVRGYRFRIQTKQISIKG